MDNDYDYEDNPDSAPFCGDSFWDDFKPLYNSSNKMPVLTECFQHTALVYIPCFFFWILMPILMLQLKLSEKKPLPWTTIMSMKWLVSVMLIFDRTFVVVVSFWQYYMDDSPIFMVDLVYPTLQAATLFVMSAVKDACRRKGIRSSGILFCTWLLFAVCGSMEFYSWIVIGSDQQTVAETDFFRYFAYLVYYPLVLIQLFLMCFADPLTIFGGYENTNNPYSSASFLNRQSLWWFGSLVSLGNKRPLQVDDVFELDPELRPDYLQKKWKEVWSGEMRKYLLSDRRYQTERNHEEPPKNDTSPLLGEAKKTYGAGNNVQTGSTRQTGRKAPKLPSIVKTLWKLFKWELLGASLIKICCDVLQFANPAFLNLLITFTEDVKAPWYEGMAYAIGLGASAFLRSLLMNNYFTEMFRVGAQLQAVLTTAVYEKTLKLSNTARRDKTVGEIVNLMAIDVERFKSITPQLQQYWSSPFQIILSLFFLSQTIGWAVVSGVLIMICIIPVNFGVSILCRNWQIKQMRLKDQRIKMSNEILNGIKVIKLYAWEPAMEKAINDIRIKEMALVKRASTIRNACDVFNVSAPFLVAASSFATYVLTDPSHVLTPQIAFVSLTLFNQLRGPLMMAADLIGQTVQAVVSNKRLKEFLVANELCDTSVDRESTTEYYEKTLETDNVTWTWDREVPPILKNVDLDVPNAKLLAVVGRVGVGKSSLLSGVLGEMEKLRGYVGVRGSVAYVSQQPWIQNITLRENIIMDKDFNPHLYNSVIEACALNHDLDLLPAGDMTEIGEKGINLSGGQKARVALARAVYQDRDIFLLDDPLSAVDAHVARHIFDKVIGPQGLLREKTRVLVTHGISFIKEADLIAVVKDNQIARVDTFDNLSKDPELDQYLKEAEIQKKEDLTPESSVESRGSGSASDAETDVEVKSVLSKISVRSRKSTVKSIPKIEIERQKHTLIEAERAETGRVKPRVYLDYFKAMGLLTYAIPCIAFMTTNTVFTMMRSLWLTSWSDENVAGVDPSKVLPIAERLGVYVGLGLIETFLFFVGMILLIFGSVNASLNLHAPLLHNVLRSPLSFFDVTPLGRILNRLGKDMEVVDLRLSSNFRFLLISFLQVIQVVIMITLATPLFIVVIVPVLFVYFFILRYFIKTSRQLQRLASITRSPIYSHFGESIQGASTIRAFGWTNNFIELSKEKLELHLRCSYYSLISNRWLSVRLELLGNVIILSTAVLAIISKDWGTMTAGLIGLSVSYSLNITFMLNLLVRQISEVETNVVSVERIKDYAEMVTEAPWQGRKRLPIGWPQRGEIQFKNTEVRYRPGLDLVLKGITAHIGSGEKVGVVGRTGAGKSSLSLVMFRIIEPCGGSILLDGIDISTIGLHELRRNITIIPQDPVLFSGTLRFNLDPTDEYCDSDLWMALEHAHLRDFVSTLPMGLAYTIDEGGQNISVGQRQLVCLTRALLRKSQVLILDEATAAVDTQTDALIQATIRKEFSTCTVVTIAHRLNTVMDYDKIMVMKNGEVAEFGSPGELMSNRESAFYSMAHSAGLV